MTNEQEPRDVSGLLREAVDLITSKDGITPQDVQAHFKLSDEEMLQLMAYVYAYHQLQLFLEELDEMSAILLDLFKGWGY